MKLLANYTKKEIASTGLILFAAICVQYELITQDNRGVPIETNTLREVAGNEPERKDFEGVPPAGFPTDFPIEKGVAVSESYTLAYPESTQMSYVYSVEKPSQETFHQLESYFARQGYVAINSYRTAQLMTLYVRQGSMDVSVIVEGYDTSKVTLNVLKNY